MMNKRARNLAMRAVAMGGFYDTPFVLRDRFHEPEPPEPKPEKERKEFAKAYGVNKAIAQYKLINSGNSKLGVLKQKRVINNIERWLKGGNITEAELK